MDRLLTRRGLMPAVLVALALTLGPLPLQAQAVRGTLLGNVTDEAGLGVPGATVTATIAKLCSIGTARAGLRIDAFNLFNTPHFQLCDENGQLGNANFGRVTSVIDFNERPVRFGLKVTF